MIGASQWPCKPIGCSRPMALQANWVLAPDGSLRMRAGMAPFYITRQEESER